LPSFEFGVRMALGASRPAIVAMILRDGVAIVGAGCAIGALLAFAIARVLQSVITSQSLVDPVAFAAGDPAAARHRSCVERAARTARGGRGPDRGAEE